MDKAFLWPQNAIQWTDSMQKNDPMGSIDDVDYLVMINMTTLMLRGFGEVRAWCVCVCVCVCLHDRQMVFGTTLTAPSFFPFPFPFLSSPSSSFVRSSRSLLSFSRCCSSTGMAQRRGPRWQGKRWRSDRGNWRGSRRRSRGGARRQETRSRERRAWITNNVMI